MGMMKEKARSIEIDLDERCDQHEIRGCFFCSAMIREKAKLAGKKVKTLGELTKRAAEHAMANSKKPGMLKRQIMEAAEKNKRTIRKAVKMKPSVARRSVEKVAQEWDWEDLGE